MALSFPLDIVTEFPGWTTDFRPVYAQERGRNAKKTFVKDLADPLWTLSMISRQLSPNELDYWRGRFAALENGIGTFLGYNKARCYPIAYPNGSWPGNVAGRVNRTGNFITQVYTINGQSGFTVTGVLSVARALEKWIPSSTGVLTQVAANLPARSDLGLLIESGRTNTIRNNTNVGAVAGSPGTMPTNWGLPTSASGISRHVIATGTVDGIDYITLRFSGTAGALLNFSTLFDLINNPSAAAAIGQIWTTSAWVDILSGSLPGVTFTIGCAETDGASLIGATTATIAPPTNNLKTGRFEVTHTNANVAVTNQVGYVIANIPNGATVDFQIRIGSVQLERSSGSVGASSVIKTSGAAVTRPVDTVTIFGNGTNNWQVQSEFGVIPFNNITGNLVFNTAGVGEWVSIYSATKTGAADASPAPTITTINANRKAIALGGMTVDYVIGSGDYLMINNRDLHQVVESAVVNAGNGISNQFEIRPHLYPDVVTTLPVSFIKPSAVMQIIPDSVSYNVDLSGRGTISFSAMEYRA